MAYDDSKYSLLPKDDGKVDLEDGEEAMQAHYHKKQTLISRMISIPALALIALTISLALNVVQLRQNRIARAQRHLCVSEYSMSNASILYT